MTQAALPISRNEEKDEGERDGQASRKHVGLEMSRVTVRKFEKKENFTIPQRTYKDIIYN